MAVNKIYSNYKDKKHSEIQRLQEKVDELNSLSDEYYISQRDRFNQQQKDEWNKKKENLQKYSKKYHEDKNLNLIDKVGERDLILQRYIEYNIFEISGEGPISVADMIMNPQKKNIALDPSNIMMPDEPIPETELQPFKEPIQQKVRKLEGEIELLKTKLDTNVSTSELSPIYLEYGSGEWLYQDSVYEALGGQSNDEKILLIREFADKDRRRFERLKNKFSGEKSEELKYERTRISEEVRIAVWRRDQGKCARCGNRENLEYDHIVPVSKGGGNTERNIELLCQDCNRAKSNRIE